MEPTNTTIFSSLSDILKEKIVQVDEECPIHHQKKVVAFDKSPVCEACVQEDIEKQTEQLVRRTLDAIEKRCTVQWLNNRSILADDSLRRATFDTYLTEDAETTTNKSKALQIAREYYKGAKFNTVFTGKPGTGKSHLAMSILRVVNENSKPYRRCLFISLDEVMRRIRDSFNNQQSTYTEQNVVELLVEADILVLDDLGAETGSITSTKIASDFTTKILYAIINGRMEKPTIITTNLTSHDMSKMYDSKLISRMLRGTKGHAITFNSTSDKRLNS